MFLQLKFRWQSRVRRRKTRRRDSAAARALCSTMSQQHGDNWMLLYGGDD